MQKMVVYRLLFAFLPSALWFGRSEPLLFSAQFLRKIRRLSPFYYLYLFAANSVMIMSEQGRVAISHRVGDA